MYRSTLVLNKVGLVSVKESLSSQIQSEVTEYQRFKKQTLQVLNYFKVTFKVMLCFLILLCCHAELVVLDKG